jgi:hypothetical protein
MILDGNGGSLLLFENGTNILIGDLHPLGAQAAEYIILALKSL